MSSNKNKTPEKQLKTIKIWKRIVTTFEVIFGIILIAAMVILFVPNVKAEIIKGMATTPIGQKIISWFGSEAYVHSVFDSNFDNTKLKTNELKYNYSQEYTTFVLFGVDSREGEVEASNSDSILVVNIHNTTGEVKMVSIYRDTMLGIYDADGNLMKVDIIPDTLKASVKVTKPSKDVPITLNPTGVIPNDKSIESYKLDKDHVTIYAKQSVLDNIDEIPITIPASTLTSDREISMPIIMPNGVTKISSNIANISIKLTDTKERVIKDVPIAFKNSIDGLNFTVAQGSSSSVDVTVKGAKDVISKIKKEELQVYVDLSKIEKAGTYEQPLIVEGKNKLATYVLKNGSVKVTATGSVADE